MTEKILKAENEAEYILNQLKEQYGKKYDMIGEFAKYGNGKYIGYEIDIYNNSGNGILLYTAMMDIINKSGYRYTISIINKRHIVIMFNDYKVEGY